MGEGSIAVLNALVASDVPLLRLSQWKPRRDQPFAMI